MSQSLKKTCGGDSMKKQKRPGWPNFMFPSPVVLVSCLDEEQGRANIITLAWASNLIIIPPTIGVGINRQRHSYQLIKSTKEFVVNIPSTRYLYETDFCGMVSGKEVDKFLATKFTAEPATKVKPPLIKECPVNIECRVYELIESESRSHGIFLGEILMMHVDEEILTLQETIDYSKADPILYLVGEYWSLGKKLGVHGLSKGKTRN